MALLTEHAEQDNLGGGRFRQTIAIKRIAYRLDGNLRRITNALANTGDPALSIGVAELMQFRVADRLAGQSPIIHFGKGASNVRLTPLATNNVNALVAGNVVTYPGAWDNADLRYSIGGHILRKEILLRAGHPSSFAFRVASHAGLNIDTLSTPDFRILQPSLEGPNGEHIPLVWGVSSSGGKYVLTCTLPPGDYAGWVVDPTLVLQPDATDGVDAQVSSNAAYADNNYGLSASMRMDYEGVNQREFCLFRFSGIPTAGTVTSVTFSLYFGTGGTVSVTVAVYAIASGNANWPEGQQAGGVPPEGQDGCTWNHFNHNGSVNWAGSAGLQTADTDYVNTVLASLSLNPAVGGWKTFTGNADFVATVQGWVTNPATNYGLLVRPTGSYTDFYPSLASSDNATAANRPKLTIEYTLPATGMSRAPIASWCH